MFYLDRKVRGAFIPVLDPETRELKLFKDKTDALAYAAYILRLPAHRLGRVTICRN